MEHNICQGNNGYLLNAWKIEMENISMMNDSEMDFMERILKWQAFYVIAMRWRCNDIPSKLLTWYTKTTVLLAIKPISTLLGEYEIISRWSWRSGFCWHRRQCRATGCGETKPRRQAPSRIALTTTKLHFFVQLKILLQMLTTSNL